MLSVFNGEGIKENSAIDSSVASLEALKKAYIDAADAANKLKWTKGESSDDYKQKTKEQIQAAAELKMAMEYAEQYGSSSSAMWTVTAKDSGGDGLLDSVTKYLESIKKVFLTEEE